MASPLLAIYLQENNVTENDIPPLRQEFHNCLRIVKPAVDKAREDWIFKVANDKQI